jgi:hypothetical protein
MRNYLITITMHDGSRGRCRGAFANDWAAIDAVLGAFHDAASVVPRRLA